MALKWLRDNLKHLKFVLWGVVFVFIALVFVDWGSGRANRRAAAGSYAVRVGDTGMTEAEFLRQLSNMNSRYQRQFGEQWEQFREQLDLPRQITSQFINRELLAAEAARLGLVVTDEELAESIRDQFSDGDGRFIGSERYQAYVRREMGKTPSAFEEDTRKQLLLQKLSDLTQRGLFIADAEAEESYRSSNEKATLDIIQVGHARFLSQVDAEDEEVAAYYAENADELRREEQRVIRYFLVETSRLRRLLPVADAEIEEYYKSHSDEYMEGEKAQARHILISVPPGADETARAEAQVKAEAVAKMARQGADFAELASKHSEDPGSKDKGGDLGWFGRGQMTKPFEDAVFNNKPGDIVGPITSEYGLHVIKVEGFKAASLQPLDEVRDQVKYRLLEGRSAAEAEVRATALEKRLREQLPADDDTWQAVADEDEAVVLNVSPAFAKGDQIAGIGNDPELVSEAFSTEAGQIGGKRSVARGWIVWQLKEVKPEGVPPLDEIKDVVAQKVLRRKALELAAEKAAELAAQWRDGADPEALATSIGSSVTSAADHRRGASIAELGAVSNLDTVVFSSAAGEVVGPVETGDQALAIARIDTLQLVDDEELEENLEAERTRLIEERAGQLLSSIIIELRRQHEAEIKIDDTFIERYRSQGQG